MVRCKTSIKRLAKSGRTLVYKVKITNLAKQDARDYPEFLRDNRAPDAAIRWLKELESAIDSHSGLPERFVKVQESSELSGEFRQFIHYSHRVIYRIEEESKTVFVLRIYHGARRNLKDNDVE